MITQPISKSSIQYGRRKRKVLSIDPINVIIKYDGNKDDNNRRTKKIKQIDIVV